MIFDTLQNAHLYYGLGDRIEVAFRYLQEHDVTALSVGRHDIDGDNLYLIVNEYQTKTAGRWEAHRAYIDIQYIVQGREKIGFVDINQLTSATPYDETKDLIFLEGDGSFLVAEEGSFALFAPQDAHMPGLSVGESAFVRKVVVKIKIS